LIELIYLWWNSDVENWPDVIKEYRNNSLVMSALGGCLAFLRSVREHFNYHIHQNKLLNSNTNYHTHPHKFLFLNCCHWIGVHLLEVWKMSIYWELFFSCY
jgi:hypothetical protein